MNQSTVSVVKVGGSLLDWPLLASHLQAWLSDRPTAFHVLLAGGGRFVDAVRDAQYIHYLNDNVAHWLAIDAMSATARLLAALLGEIPRVDQWQALLDRLVRNDRPAIVFDPRSFLHHEEPWMSGTRLPHGWDVTSDSIAARIALQLGADELVLLKSTLCDEGLSFEAAADAGYVDWFFPKAAAGLHVCCVNLREPNDEPRWLKA